MRVREGRPVGVRRCEMLAGPQDGQVYDIRSVRLPGLLYVHPDPDDHGLIPPGRRAAVYRLCDRNRALYQFERYST